MIVFWASLAFADPDVPKARCTDSADTVAAFTARLERVPLQEDAPDMAGRVWACTQGVEEVGKLALAFAEQYGHSGTWTRRFAADADRTARARGSTELILRLSATEMQIAALRAPADDAPRLRQLADPLYAAYLAEFPAGKYSYDMHYAYGELLYKLEDHERAAVQYQAVVDMHPRGAHSLFCAMSLVFELGQLLTLPNGAVRRGTPLDASETRLRAAVTQLLQYASDPKFDGEFAASASLGMGDRLERHGLEVEAGVFFLRAVETAPNGPTVTEAARRLLNAVRAAGGAAGTVHDHAQALLALPGLVDPALRAELQAL